MESEAGMSDPIDRASLVAFCEQEIRHADMNAEANDDSIVCVHFQWLADMFRALLLGLQAPPAYLAVDSTTVTAGNLPDRAGNVNEFTRTLVGQAPDWQPIDSAPKDGTHVLVTDGTAVVEMRWDDNAWYELNNHSTDAWGRPWYDGEATHWMPLPAAPGRAV
jgi:hypothetical protein